MKRAGRKEAKTRLTFVSSANLCWISGQFNKEGKKEKKKRKRKRKKKKSKKKKKKKEETIRCLDKEYVVTVKDMLQNE